MGSGEDSFYLAAPEYFLSDLSGFFSRFAVVTDNL